MTKHAGGRPTVATPENVEKAWQYVNGDWQLDEVIPTVEGLAVYLRISRETIYAREEFSDIAREIKEKQSKILVSSGLKGDFNSVIAKLILSSKHGYVEKSEIKTENPLKLILEGYGLTEGSDARETDQPVPGAPKD